METTNKILTFICARVSFFSAMTGLSSDNSCSKLDKGGPFLESEKWKENSNEAYVTDYFI